MQMDFSTVYYTAHLPMELSRTYTNMYAFVQFLMASVSCIQYWRITYINMYRDTGQRLCTLYASIFIY